VDRMEYNRRGDSNVASASASPSPERDMRNTTHAARQHMARRAVCIVSDEPTTVPQTLQVEGLDTGAHNINNKGGGVGVSDGGVEVGVGVVDGIVSSSRMTISQWELLLVLPVQWKKCRLQEFWTGPNERQRRNTITVEAPDVTPRAAAVNLPLLTSTGIMRPDTIQNRISDTKVIQVWSGWAIVVIWH
jgi:hypothetical protein